MQRNLLNVTDASVSDTIADLGFLSREECYVAELADRGDEPFDLGAADFDSGYISCIHEGYIMI